MPQRQANGWHEDVEDSFIVSGKSEEHLKKWADKILELATTEKKKQEEIRAAHARRSDRYSAGERQYLQSAFAPPTPYAEHPAFVWPTPISPNEEEDGLRSGRNTPSIGSSATYMSQSYGHASGRRVQSQQSIPPDRQAEHRARAMTEDQYGPSMAQWKSQHQQPPPLPRLTSAMSALSTASEASFGMPPAPRFGRQMSQSRLGRAEEIEEESPTEADTNFARYGPARGMTRAPSHGVGPTVPYPPPLRSRSASTPNVYQLPKASPSPVPPMPHSAWNESPTMVASSSSTLVGGTAYFAKRMSGSNRRSSSGSHSTETSETSSQSPATPYDTVSRQNSQEMAMLLVRVRCGEDQFVISVGGGINWKEFYHRVYRKIRMCARSNAVSLETGVTIKWIDADNDEITIRCDADLEAMFAECVEIGTNCVNIVAR